MVTFRRPKDFARTEASADAEGSDDFIWPGSCAALDDAKPRIVITLYEAPSVALESAGVKRLRDQ